jgi:E3 ubiquitin-protein ligase UBR1
MSLATRPHLHELHRLLSNYDDNTELLPLHRAAITRELYRVMLSMPEGRAALLPLPEDPSPPGAYTPSPGPPSWDDRALEDWLVHPEENEGFGPQRVWSLLDAQHALDERNRRLGKPGRMPKPGSVCGKVLQRFERTYICK